jgi:hypothetical protein
MNSRSTSVPWNYLKQASLPALQSFELSRLNHAANIRKELEVLLDEYLEECSAAMVARYLLNRGAQDVHAPHGPPNESFDDRLLGHSTSHSLPRSPGK